MTISGGRTKQLDIFYRVTTSDFLSFIVVELIWFFHGAIHIYYPCHHQHSVRTSHLRWFTRTLYGMQRHLEILVLNTVKATFAAHCYVTLSQFQRPFSRWTWVSRYQNVSILDCIGANGDGRLW